MRKRVLANLRNVDEKLAARVADGLDMRAAAEVRSRRSSRSDMEPSPALRIVGKYPPTLQGSHGRHPRHATVPTGR